MYFFDIFLNFDDANINKENRVKKFIYLFLSGYDANINRESTVKKLFIFIIVEKINFKIIT